MAAAPGPLRVCVVTSSRADWGLLHPVVAALRASPRLHTQLVVTGSHLEAQHGLTVSEVRQSGPLDREVLIALHDDRPTGIAVSMGLALTGFVAAFGELAPDLVLLLGDRFEIFAVAQAALLCRLPIAHLCGGDVTEGAWDDALRHSISKMAHLHFPSHAAAGHRLRQLGERDDRIHVVGSPGIDALQRLTLLRGTELEVSLGFTLRPRNVLVTFHPETLSRGDGLTEQAALFAALDAFGPDLGVLLTMPNADALGSAFAAQAHAFAAPRDHVVAFTSLGALRYLSAMAACDAVVGNSSSGLYEAPSLGVPTVNIGGRQDGRPRADSVIDVPTDAAAIEAGMRRAFTLDCAGVQNPYGDGHSAARIAAVLEALTDPRALLRKGFIDREFA